MKWKSSQELKTLLAVTVGSSFEKQSICDVGITFLQSSLDHRDQAATPGPLTECRW